MIRFYRLFRILLPSISLYDGRLSHLNKHYLLTYLLTYGGVVPVYSS